VSSVHRRCQRICADAIIRAERSLRERSAKKYLLNKQREANGLIEENIEFSDQAVLDIMRHYTREAGVRNLEREISCITSPSCTVIVSLLRPGTMVTSTPSSSPPNSVHASPVAIPICGSDSAIP
jgi:ATP-dependent Lon protease